ncbi:D-aminoacyl-tRNA deacylase [Methanococcus voltae]|uniref:D-aminoacyl-tRNA deacylase n=1 Tax=Methanococcus voltae (strain ATCC BAA-1334 / A3) TaxID=456320 RepID=D7DTN7_METV3|nr:D-aminoacyl-tRNA deacylase [Methanococcus voltae]MCS3901351.1 D-aminoacyl-tRNA deacylase [Methanococcus voltae]
MDNVEKYDKKFDIKNYVLISSKQDPASQNLKEEMEKKGYKIFEIDERTTRTDKTIYPKAECYIFLSKHASATGKPTLTVHTQGNLTEDNSHGGNPEEIPYCMPELNTILLQKINDYNNEYNKEYNKEYVENKADEKITFEVSFEVLHHGPTDLDAPCVFVEIGSTEEQWQMKDPARIIANALDDTLNILLKNEQKPLKKAIGLGGGHYSPKFTKLALKDEYYLGYLVPKHAKLSKNMFMQLLTKQPVDVVLIDWKGLYGEDKRRYIQWLEDLGIEWLRI